jgi:hypothetical protein
MGSGDEEEERVRGWAEGCGRARGAVLNRQDAKTPERRPLRLRREGFAHEGEKGRRFEDGRPSTHLPFSSSSLRVNPPQGERPCL